MKERECEGLRQALGQFATGVTIVTTMGPTGEPVGVTANSFNSVSLEPPLVLWSLSTEAFSRKIFESASHFCVHVLAASQETLSRRFGARGANKFDGLKWDPGIGSVPMLDACVARFQCRMTQQYPVGDHVVFVGEVLEFDMANRRPLVFHGGRYAQTERRMMEKLARELADNRSLPEDRRGRKKPI